MFNSNYDTSEVERSLKEAVLKAGISKNVFTGEPFGTTEEKNGLDANSLFTVDEDTLQKAFALDERNFQTA